MDNDDTRAPWRMTKYESNPSAAFMIIYNNCNSQLGSSVYILSVLLTFPFAAPITVGSHLLSRESMSKNTASCPSMRLSKISTSAFACAIEFGLGGIGCPGMGIARVWPVAFYS